MLRFNSISRQGERKYNEDYLGHVKHDKKYCFVLADGLGGHGRGEAASKLVVEDVIASFNQNKMCNFESIAAYLNHAQQKLLKTQEENNCKDQMKTTSVVLTVDTNLASWTHVGDSRMYHFCRGGYVHTDDHSVPWVLYKNGEINKEDIRHHADRNKLYSVMGSPWNKSPFKPNSTILQQGDAMLLCSDGFWEYIDETKMLEFLEISQTPEQWLSFMESEIVKNGTGTNMDNYSAIAIMFSEEDIRHSKNHTKEIQKLNDLNRPIKPKQNAIQKPKRKTVNILLLGAVVIAIIAILVGEIFFDISKEFRYKDALSLLNGENYEEAIESFEKIKTYKDSSEKIIEARFAQADVLLEQGMEDEAYDIVLNLFNDWNLHKDDVTGIQLAEYYYNRGNLNTAGFIISNLQNIESIQDISDTVNQYMHHDYLSTSGTFAAFVSTESNMLNAGDSSIKGYNLNTDSNSVYSIYPNDYTNISSVACGSSFIIAMHQDGTISSTDSSISLSQINNAMSISAENESYIILKKDGTVYAGDNMINHLDSWSNIIDADAGDKIYAALISDGSVLIKDTAGNSLNENTAVQKWKNVVKISAGGSKVYGLTMDGCVYCYDTANPCTAPVFAEGFENIVKMDAYGNYFAALDADGKIKCNANYLKLNSENIQYTDVKVGITQWHYLNQTDQRILVVGLKEDSSIDYTNADFNKTDNYTDLSQINGVKTLTPSAPIILQTDTEDKQTETVDILVFDSDKLYAEKEFRFPENALYNLNDDDEYVLALNYILRENGYSQVTLSNIYDEFTLSAVENVQRQNGLDADGIAGANTLKVIEDMYNNKISK